MTDDEARFVLTLMGTADGACSTCVADLFEEYLERFPEHEAIAQEVLSVPLPDGLGARVLVRTDNGLRVEWAPGA